MNWPKITPAEVAWQGGSTPVSKTFDDVYFLPGKGLEEKSCVFLDGVGLDELLAKNTRLSIAELGFGTGLNFLLTWRRARETKTRLDYVAFEGFPLTAQDLERSISQIPEPDSRCYQLAKSWPPLVSGVHRVSFDEGWVTLTLVFGQILPSLKETGGIVDAWFLDGFSPHKNPDMWAPEVLKEVARLSANGTRLATYSAAGEVRRGLETAGFSVSKRAGFDKKRESLTAAFKGPERLRGLPPGAKIAVIGGGIAGCSAAYALKRKGFEVTLFEKEKALASGTSGLPLAVMRPRLEKSHNPYSAFYLFAYLFSLICYEKLEDEFGSIWHPTRGCFHQAGNKKEAADMLLLSKLFPELSDHFKYRKDPPGLMFAKAGCLVPGRLCEVLTKDVDVHLSKEFKADEAFDATVLATGHRAFEGWGKNPFRLTRGQINYLPALENHEITETISFPGGYLTPKTDQGFHVLGTSFQVLADPDNPKWKILTKENLNKNLAALKEASADLASAWQKPELKGRVGVRTETIDHLPVVGAAFDEAKFIRIFKEKQRLHHRERLVGNEANIKGLYVLSGLASRGFTSAPLAGEIIASQIAGTTPPCPAKITAALSPARFLEKSLKRGQLKAT